MVSAVSAVSVGSFKTTDGTQVAPEEISQPVLLLFVDCEYVAQISVPLLLLE